VCNAAKESFRFHRTNDIVKYSIIPAVRRRSYHDNTTDDIIRIMFAARRRKVGSLVEEKRTKQAERRLILHVEDKSSGELLKHSI